MIFRLLWFAFVAVPCGVWWISLALMVYRRLREAELVIIDRGEGPRS
jgi:hypothetical protein